MLRGMLDCIINQIHQRLLDGAAIDLRFANIAGDLSREFHLPLSRIRLHELHSLLDQLCQIGRFEFILLAALFDPREVQDVFDHGPETPAFLHDETEIFVLLLLLRHAAALESFGH